MPSDLAPDWFSQFLEDNTLKVYTESIEVPGSGPFVLEMARGVSWRAMLALLEVNNLDADKFRTELARVDGRQRGRVAMAIGNTLRGAARRRGGLYSTIGDVRGSWTPAASEWLRPTRELDYSEPTEDPEGRPLRETSNGGT
jgi:hypothetical protein